MLQYEMKETFGNRTNAKALVTPGVEITLTGNAVRHLPNLQKVETPYTKTYRVGDMAEYGSYNMSYFGEIIGIGPKTVTIRESHGTRRLRIAEFDWRNYDWSLEQATKRNAEWSD